MNTWAKTGRTVGPKGTTITYTDLRETGLTIESRKRHIPHANGRDRLRRLWDLCLEYINDIDEGLLNTEEMLACLKNEDGIVIRWRVDI